MLSLNNIEVVYGDIILVLKGLSLQLETGRIATLLGTNGAGKTTTLKAISGLLRTEDGAVTDGSITFDGERIDRLGPDEIVRRGIFQVMEGRRVFEHLTVAENLRAGAHTRPNGRQRQRDLDDVYELFPRLAERAKQRAGFLSGGEQQMLAIGRGLMARPRVMLLDEPSLGLAPLAVAEIFRIIRRINDDHQTAILLVEQNARAALAVAHYGYVMENGRIVLEGSPDTLTANDDVKEFYLGLTDVGHRRSYRDIKHYRRRKRWLS